MRAGGYYSLFIIVIHALKNFKNMQNHKFNMQLNNMIFTSDIPLFLYDCRTKILLTIAAKHMSVDHVIDLSQ